MCKNRAGGIVCIFCFLSVHYLLWLAADIQTALQTRNTGGVQEVNDLVEIAKHYAKQLVITDCRITGNDIKAVSCSWVTEMFERDRYYVGFTYRLSGEDVDRSYGYKIMIDDDNNCKVMKKGRGLGKNSFQHMSYQKGREGSRSLTIEAVKELSLKGDSLSWEDFGDYDCYDVGSGVYVLRYDINDSFFLLVGGDDMDEKPEYICLIQISNKDEYIDIRKDSVDEFIRKAD